MPLPFGMKIVTDTISLANLILAFLFLVGGAFIAWSHFKRTAFETQKQINESSEKLIKTLKDERDELERKISKMKQEFDDRSANIEKGYRVQEQRLMRVETDAERKGRMVIAAREEIRLLEEVIQIAVPAMARTSEAFPDEYERMMRKLSDLGEYRRISQREADEWESTQASLLAYHDQKALRDDVLHGIGAD